MWYIGTSGFMTSQKKWLTTNLNCIEMNSTFYKLPSEKVINNWKQFPHDVKFSIKVSRFITHIKRLHNVEAAWKIFWNRISKLGTKLNVLLFQLPPSFKYNNINKMRILKMKKFLPKNVPIVFEFRDISWFNKENYKMFKKLGWCISGTYINKKPGGKWMGTMPPGLLIPPKTSKITYLRIHGSRGYRGELNNTQLKMIKKELKSRKASNNFVMFNNTFFNKRGKFCNYKKIKIYYAAVCNAIEFVKIK